MLQNQKEKVVGHEWRDPNDQRYMTLWEDIGFVEKYLPPTSTCYDDCDDCCCKRLHLPYLPNPLADLLLKVIKPVVKKVSAIQKKIGKTPYSPKRLSDERVSEEEGLAWG